MDLELGQQRVLIYKEWVGPLEEGPYLFCFRLHFGPGFLLCLSLVIFFCFKQEHTCCPFCLQPCSQEEVRASRLTQILCGATRFSLIQNQPELTVAFLSVAKSSELKSWERCQILTRAFVSYSSMCSEGGRDTETQAKAEITAVLAPK